MQLLQRRVFVFGKVQGVSFRAGVFQKVASVQQPVYGYVKNCMDGSVEALFIGAPQAVLDCVQYCLTGPPEAHVKRCIVQEEPLEKDKTIFQILK